jgi:hypothetical protein
MEEMRIRMSTNDTRSSRGYVDKYLLIESSLLDRTYETPKRYGTHDRPTVASSVLSDLSREFRCRI